ncbi:AraC family transcriptional regulator [Cohnella soli]|uniref:AraC family transcriptional regulator n=1 Tax=Cohnella soli TaxID=425005 RepID=A0ABW0I0H0_9BACL
MTPGFSRLLRYRSCYPHIRFAHFTKHPRHHVKRYIYDHEWILIEEGAGAVESENGKLPYEKNALLLIPPGIVHSFVDERGPDFAQYAVHFDWEPRPQLSTELWCHHTDTVTVDKGSFWVPKILVIPSLPASIQQQLKEVVAAFQSNGAYRKLAHTAAFLRFVESLATALYQGDIRAMELNRPQGSDSRKVREEVMRVFESVHRLVEESAFDKSDFDRICSESHFSASHLRRLFRVHTGYSPHQYFTMLRMRKAGELLLQSSLSIEEISFLCGYEDAKYFSRLFRNREGLSPQQYRQAITIN